MISRVVILNDASVARGGATGLTLLLIKKLRHRGISVTFIVGDKGDNEELQKLGVEIIPVRNSALMKEKPLVAATRGIYSRHAAAVVSAWINENDNPDTIYHMHGWSKILSPSAFSAMRKVAHRTVIHAHDFFLACPNGAFMDYQRELPCSRVPLSFGCITTNCDKRSYSQKVWRIARQYALLLATSPDVVPWARVLLIHEGMRLPLAKSPFPSAALTSIRNPARAFTSDRVYAENNSRFFFIGRLEAEKGIEDALVAARLAGVQLDVIGDGPLRQELELRFGEVTFHGWLDRDEIGERIRAARALVIPSRYPEPFGLVAAEAAMSGVPVIINSNALLASEIVTNGIGLGCDTRNPARLAECLRHIAAMEYLNIKAMSKRGFENTPQIASTEEEWVNDIVDVYTQCLATPR